MKIILSDNNSYKWIKKKNLYYKGQIIYNDKKIRSELLIKILKKKNYKNIISKFEGIFQIIFRYKDNIRIITDCSRTFAIFYSLKKKIISDKAKNCIDEKIINSDQKNFFIKNYYTPGDQTLIKDTYQNLAGEIITFSKNKKKSDFYFLYYKAKFSKINFTSKKKELHLLMHKIINDIIVNNPQKQFIIPLSGGYDSRLILSLLNKMNYKNIICFTYGSKHSYEIRIAKKICKENNVNHIIIEYSASFFDKYFKKKEFLDYLNYSFNYSSLPHFQEFYSIKYLLQKKHIKKDCIILPGFTADVFSGSMVTNKNLKNVNLFQLKDKLSKIYPKKKFVFQNKNLKNLIDLYCNDRITKFIINSSRVYSFFNLKFLFPLRNISLMKFFSEIDYAYKNANSDYSKNLYKSSIFDYFKEQNIDIKKKFTDRTFLILLKIINFKKGDSLNLLHHVFYKNIALNFKKSGEYERDMAIYLYNELTNNNLKF